MSDDIRIFDTTNVNPERVQHQQLFYSDEDDRFVQRMTIYTGELKIGHGTGGSIKDVHVEYPLLARFPPVGAGPRVGIFPINEPLPPGAAGRSQFRSAVADASLALMWGKDAQARYAIHTVTAELDRIVLDNPREPIFAVVFKGIVSSMYSMVELISYRVSVLERITHNPELPQQREPGWNWNGKYLITPDGHVGVQVWPGVPQT